MSTFLKFARTFLNIKTITHGALIMCFTVALLFSNIYAEAAINKQFNYQGKLTNTSNIAVTDGGYNMSFSLYTSGGTTIWTENKLVSAGQGVTVTNGLFSTMLGSVASLSGVDFNQTLYLGVTIGGTGSSPTWDSEMSPRKIIGSVPSAFVADTLQGLGPDRFFRSDTANSTSTTNTYFSITNSGTGNIADFIGQGSVNALTVKSNGNVGVGTTSPATSLSVSGSGYITGGLGVGIVNSNAGTLQTSGAGTIGGNLSVGGQLNIYNSSIQGYNSGGGTNDSIKIVSSNAGAGFAVQNTNGSGYSGIEYIGSDGNVKVFTGYNNGNTGEFRFNNIAPSGFITFKISGTDRFTINNSGAITLSSLGGSGNRLVQTDNNGNLSGLATSSLGLLTTNVAEGTNLYYTNARVENYLNGSTTLASSLNYFTKDGSSLYYTGGNVGIGTTTPNEKFVVDGKSLLAGGYAEIENDGSNGGSMLLRSAEGLTGITMYGGSAGYGGEIRTYYNGSSIFSLSQSSINFAPDGLAENSFIVDTNGLRGGYDSGSDSYNYSIFKTGSGFFVGNIGIGNRDPQYNLDVAGDINFTGTLYQNGSPFGGSTFSNDSDGNIKSFSALTSTGQDNFFVGPNAGNTSSNVYKSIFIGATAGGDAINAYNSTFLGNAAGYGAANAANSIFLGKTSGVNDTVDNTSDENSSILIGNYTSTGGFSNSIAIGQGTQNSAAQQLNIGNLLFGTGIYYSSSGTGSAIPVAGGRIGIGTSSPSSILSIGNTNGINFSTATSTFNSTGGINLASGCYSVAGTCLKSLTLTGTTGQTAYFNGTNTVVGTSSLFISANGNIGIATSSPSTTLDVSGSLSVGNSNNRLSISSAGVLSRDNGGSGTSITLAGNGNGLVIGGHTFRQRVGGAPGDGLYTQSTIQSVSGFYVGNDGLGTFLRGPEADTLEVRGSNGTNAQTFLVDNTYTNASNYERAALRWSGNVLNIGTENMGTGVARNLAFMTGSTTHMTINTNGNIGIGTTSPFANLSINASAGTTQFAIGSSTGTNFIVHKSGNIAIGTASDLGSKFYVNGTSTIAGPLTVGSGSYLTNGTSLSTQVALGIATGDIQFGRSGVMRTISVVGGSQDGSGDAMRIVAGSGGALDFNAGTNGGNLFLSGGASQGTGTAGNVILGYNGTSFVGNVGIGTTSPYAKLSVAGQAVFNNIWATSTTATNYFGGNVGIGNTSPAYALDVRGSLTGAVVDNVGRFSSSADYIGFTLNATKTGGTGQANLLFQKNGNQTWNVGSDFAANGTRDLFFYDATRGANPLYIASNGDVRIGDTGAGSSGGYFGSQRMTILASSGNVGIGNTSPSSLLDVGTYNTSLYTIKTGGFVIQPYSLNNGFISDNSYYNGSGWQKISSGYSSGFQFYNGQLLVNNANTGSGVFTQTVTFKTDFSNSGSVALGGNINSAPGNYTGSNMVVLGTGNVGIGTTNPLTRLVVSNSGNNGFEVDTNTSSQIVYFTAYNRGTGSYSDFNMRGNNMIFAVNNNNEAMRITTSGNVGIGTTSPASKLTVVGSACISAGAGATVACTTTPGNISAVAHVTANVDLAENYQTNDQSISAGDIVAIDIFNDESIIKATSTSAVIGVISSAPGLLLGSDEKNTSLRPVALAGRVPVKVSAENGEVSRGDSLTVSSVPGVAAKYVGSGPIVGVAVSTSANGKVTMFVKSVFQNSLADSISSTEPMSLGTSVSDIITMAAQSAGQWVGQRVVAVQGIFRNVKTGSLEADQVDTKNLCVEGICISKDQFKNLLEKNGIGVISAEVIETPVPLLSPSPSVQISSTASTTQPTSPPSNESAENSVIITDAPVEANSN